MSYNPITPSTEWLTRECTHADGDVAGYVWVSCDDTVYLEYWHMVDGKPWMHTNRPYPCTTVDGFEFRKMKDGWCVFQSWDKPLAHHITTREAAIKIARIYKEMYDEV